MFISSERHDKFQRHFLGEDVTYDNLRSHEKPGIRPHCREYIFRKALIMGVKLTPLESV